MFHKNNSLLVSFGILSHDVLLGEILQQLVIFAFTLLFAASFSKTCASLHLDSKYAIQPGAIEQQEHKESFGENERLMYLFDSLSKWT